MAIVGVRLSGGQVVFVDEEDLDLFRKHSWHSHRQSGRIRTRCRDDGQSSTYELHKEVAIRMRLRLGDGVVDHRDGDRLNHSRSNLRMVSHAGNARNRMHWTKYRNPELPRGVTIPHGKTKRYRVTFRHRHVGMFDTIEDAAACHKALVEKHHGDCAWFLRPPPIESVGVIHDAKDLLEKMRRGCRREDRSVVGRYPGERCGVTYGR